MTSSETSPNSANRNYWFPQKFANTELESTFLHLHRNEALQVMRWGALVALFLLVVYLWEDQDLSPNGQRATLIRLYIGVPLCLVVWYLCGKKEAARFIEQMTVVFLWLYTSTVIAIVLVFEPGPHGLSGNVGGSNFVVILLGTFTLAYLRFHLALLAAAGILAQYLAAMLLWGSQGTYEFISGGFSIALFASVVGASSNYLFESLRRRQFLLAHKLEKEKEKYKHLLYTLVPNYIASRIEEGEFPIADSHAEIAILFADLVGFTTLTKTVAPRALVQLLNELFYEFDRAAEQYHVEKIKTIGDGYMAACGPPIEEDLRTSSVIRMAIEMVAITESIALKHKIQLSIRVGIHTGSLIAGVIGKSRYTYDMWGDSVNMASRMESSGVANRVHLSEEAYHRVASQFCCESRGEIQIKGVGGMKTYLIAESEMKSHH